MFNSRHVSKVPLVSISLEKSEYSSYTAVTGYILWALLIVSADPSLNPYDLILPSSISSLNPEAYISIGISGSTLCIYKRSIYSTSNL